MNRIDEARDLGCLAGLNILHLDRLWRVLGSGTGAVGLSGHQALLGRVGEHVDPPDDFKRSIQDSGIAPSSLSMCGIAHENCSPASV